MLKLNIHSNVGAEETKREPKTLTGRRASPRAVVTSALLRIAALLLLLAALGASAADSAANSALSSGADATTSPLQPLLDGLLGKYGWLTTVILVIGSLRLLFKPVMLAIENYVKQTPSTADDERLAKFEAGPIYKIIAFLLDLGASIKLPLITPPTNKDQ